MFPQFITEHQSTIFAIFAILTTFWILFVLNLLKTSKTLKLGLFLIFISLCLLFLICYYQLKNSPPKIYTFKKLCGTYEYNSYEPTLKGRGHYNFHFNLDNYGSYEAWANHEKIAQIGQFPFYRNSDLNALIEKQRVCIYASFNILKPNIIDSTLAIDTLTKEYPFEYKVFCGIQAERKNLKKINALDEQPYEIIFDLDNYGQLSHTHYRGKDYLLGDNQFTTTNQKVCLLTELPKHPTNEQLTINSNNILLLELKDQPNTKLN